jgi:hypothetical protein
MYITHQTKEEARQWAIHTNAALCCITYPRAAQPSIIVLATVAWGQECRTYDMRPASREVARAATS